MNFEGWLEGRFEVRRGSDPSQVSIHCPFCHVRFPGSKLPDTKFHLGISLDPNLPVCHCFRCSYKSHVEVFVAEIEGVPRGSIKFTPGSPIKYVKPVVESKPISLPSEYRLLDSGNRFHARAWMYLESRGVDPVLIHAYELGYCLTGEFAQRIIIPIRFHGEMVGFTSRTLESSVQKYKFPVGFESSRFLFNYDRAASSKYLVLMEGPFDAMKMPLCAVAVFTNRLSVFQELLVVKGAWEEVIVLFDQDATSNAYTVFKRLSQFKPCRLARLAKSKDPGEAPLVEVEEAVQGAGGIEKFFL